MSQGTAGLTKIAIDTTTIGDGASIAAYVVDSAGALVTSTLVGADQSLDVNVAQSALPAGAATETTLASILTDLNLLTNIDGAAWSSGNTGAMSLAVRKDASGAFSGVADGDFSPLQLDSNGALKVSGTFSIDETGDYAEDSAHSSGATGYLNLSVRNDNQATTMTSANGDYASAVVDDRGATYVKDVAAKSNLQQIMTVGTSAVALPASPLSGRSSMFVQMLSSGQLYLGSATVTNSGSARGLQIGNGGFVTLDVGPANLVYGIASAAGKDVVVWEFA